MESLQINKKSLFSLFAVSIFLIFTSGCSSKQRYKPVSVSEEKLIFKYNPLQIKSINYNISTLTNGKVVAKTGEIKNILAPEGYETLFYREPLTIFSDKKGNLDIYKDKIKISELNFPHRVATASISENSNILAFVLENNQFGFYSLMEDKVIFEEKFSPVTTYDRRLPNPIFYKDTLFLFTLDGKMVLFDTSEVAIKKVFTVSSGVFYNNVIDYKLTDSALILVTQTELVVIKENAVEKRFQKEIRGAIFDDKVIYLFTKNGEIFKLNEDLKVLDQAKFPLAYFVNFGENGNHLYVLESQGYFIKMRKDRLADHKVFKSELDDENCFVTKTYFLCDRKTMSINQPILK